MKSGARGVAAQLQRFLGSSGTVNYFGEAVPIAHGFTQGLTQRELFATVPSWREGLSSVVESTLKGYNIRATESSKAFTVLARAMRSARPGIVFARAAANGEVDPLTDLDSRLLVGLPIA